ncbi:MAG TPA: S46 family peptidase [Chthoniobacterales bacterium]|nr:S46 family peptidase [Chthoniobacterales bacterium]
MKHFLLRTIAVLGLQLSLFVVLGGRADEGFWLFNAPPLKQLQEKYRFMPDQAWLEHLQKSSVRFNGAGSGSFVSADGLVITNHHVASASLQQFSDAEHNYVRDGFYAATQAEEKRCYDLELNVLQSIEDVTDRVNAAVPSGANPDEALAARRKAIADIELESTKTTGLRSDVVTLFEGGSYQLYRYKQYTDVRLVFAPEQGIAFFGGDPDNFEYPRYNLDICLLRVYENNQPVHPQHYLRFNARGPSEHDLVLVSGNPGRTDRMCTVAALKEKRDTIIPALLATLYRREVLLSVYSERSNENARRAREHFLYVQNSRKVYDGALAGLLDPETLTRISEKENGLKSAAASDRQFSNLVDSYSQIQKAVSSDPANTVKFLFYEDTHVRSSVVAGIRANPLGFNSQLFRIARCLVRAAEERQKPDEKRLPEYRESALPALEVGLFSEAPIYDDLELLTLSDSLTGLVSQYGVDDPVVRTLLKGKSPRERAYELVKSTRLKDVQFRRQLYAGGIAGLSAAADPMTEFAQATDAPARGARQMVEEQDETASKAYAQIAKAKLGLEKSQFAPDATFTLRLSYGTVEGYQEEGKTVPAFTDFAGLYQRADQHENHVPFQLPARWADKRSSLDLQTPFNFACTADSVGGNSGSPIVNRAGEFVGILFDGNLQSLSWDYLYSDKQARTIGVDSRAILEALQKVYQVPALVDELTGKKIN